MKPGYPPATDLGIGAGLRVPHYRHVIEQRPQVDFFEIISENFMVDGGKPRFHLEAVLETYPVVQHGVALSIGSPEDLDWNYLRRLKQLVRRVEPPWVSDHLCWCGSGGKSLHDLLPLPYTSEAMDLVVERARVVQDYLEVPFALENTSSYLTYASSTHSEWEFVSEVVQRAGVGLLLDVNNVYVSAYNHGFDALEYLRAVPHARIQQIHLAGHTHLGRYIIDTHRGPIIDPVWDLYRETIALAGPIPTLIEWDDEIPSFDVLASEMARARSVRDEGIAAWAAGVSTLDSAAQWVPSAAGDAVALSVWTHGGPREAASDASATEGE